MGRLASYALVSCALAAGVLLSPTLSQAAVMSRDWKTPGDGLLTYDDVNNREWLDLPLTLLSQFPGSNREEKIQSVLSQTTAGGLFSGFSFAASDDVIALATSAGIDTATVVFDVNEDSTSRLIGYLGVTIPPTLGRRYSIGFVDEVGAAGARSGAIIFVNPQSGLEGEAGLQIVHGGGDLLRTDVAGVALFRHAVPEPSTWLLAAAPLLAGRGRLR